MLRVYQLESGILYEYMKLVIRRNNHEEIRNLYNNLRTTTHLIFPIEINLLMKRVLLS